VKSKAQRGFTIIELMVAMTVGLLLMSVLGAIYLSAMRTMDTVLQRISMNRQAREMFDILAMGGARPTANINNTSTGTVTTPASVDNHNYAFGIRGRSTHAVTRTGWSVPTHIMTLVNGVEQYTLGLPSNGGNPETTVASADYSNPIVSSEYVGDGNGITVTCADTDSPIGGCAQNQTSTLHGYLRSNINLTNARDVNGTNIVAIRLALLLVNPYSYNILFNNNKTDITTTDVYDVYWTAFRPMVESHP